MNKKQRSKRNFRKSKTWKEFRRKMCITCGNVDNITNHKLHKDWQLHHRNLDEEQYEVLNEDNFLCCNNLTHKVIHWLWSYYQEDSGIIKRLEEEMQKMRKLNK